MNYPLSPDQVDAYQRDGYLFPLDVFDDNQVADTMAELDQARLDAQQQGLESRLTQSSGCFLWLVGCAEAVS